MGVVEWRGVVERCGGVMHVYDPGSIIPMDLLFCRY